MPINSGHHWLRSGAAVLGALLILAVVWLMVWPLLRPPVLVAAAKTQPELGCAAGERPGLSGTTDKLLTHQGLQVVVRTPSNYDPRRAYGLLVAFPPAGFAPAGSERFYNLTEEATRQGYIVAYPAAVPLSRLAIKLQSTVAGEIAARWCIDRRRLVYLGHSDGGTLAEGLLLRGNATDLYPSHVMASAAGLRGSDLLAEHCPKPTSMTLVHSMHDMHFPGYGSEAAAWWAACWRCARAELITSTEADRCSDLGPCATGASLRYCKAVENHAEWPRLARDPFRYFDAAPG